MQSVRRRTRLSADKMEGYVSWLISTIVLIVCVCGAIADPEVTFDLQCTQTNLTATFTAPVTENNLFRRNMSYTLSNTACTSHQNSTDAAANSDANFMLTLNMDYSEECGTVYSQNDDHIFTNQTVTLRITDYLRTGLVQRDFYYKYDISCKMARNFSTDTGSDYFEVNKAIVVTKEQTNVTEYTYGMLMNFYTDNTYNTINPGGLTVNVNDRVHVSITEQYNSSEFRFAVHRCEAMETLSGTTTDIFFDNKCGLDPTFETAYNNDNNTFSFSFQAFYFPTASTNNIYLKCRVYVCQNDDFSGSCNQACGSKRKRRDVSDTTSNGVKEITVISEPITLNVERSCSDIVCPSNSKCHDLKPAVCICEQGYVYSRFEKKCVSERITQIDKIHLNQEWNANFLNTNSEDFLRLALKYEEVLYKSFMAAGTDHVIEGVRVISAKSGSVILEVRIIYATASSPVEALNYFVESIKAKSRTATTVRNELKLIPDTTPEIVKIQEKMADIQRLTLIIIIVVLLLLVLLSAVVIVAVRKRRSRTSKENGTVAAFDNSGVVMEKYN